MPSDLLQYECPGAALTARDVTETYEEVPMARKPTQLSTPCTEWQGYRDRDGYGMIRYKRRNWRYHRWVWMQEHGPIPDGLLVMHLCDNPPCYRLDHLRLGTASDNTHDMVAKGRWRGNPNPTAHFRPLAGEESPTAKLTWGEVAEIRRLHATGIVQWRLAEQFNVSQSHISYVVRNLVWKGQR